jgi:hypothetical protein
MYFSRVLPEATGSEVILQFENGVFSEAEYLNILKSSVKGSS